MNRLKPLVAVFFFLFLNSQYCLCCWAEQEQPCFGDAYLTASIGDARTLVPILADDSASGAIVGLVFNGLVKYNKDIELVGDLAESWDIQDDGLTIIFHLRKDVRWHDGRPFSAEDVKFTYEKLIDPEIPTPYSGDFKKIKSVNILDEHTVKVTYIEPFSPGLASWGMAIMPKHILQEEDLFTADFSRNPVGTGPYRFVRWLSGNRIDLAANHDYFEHRPYIDRYIYRIIPDPASIFLELQTQGVDSVGLTPLQYQRQTDTDFFKRNFQKFRYPAFGYTYMGYNLHDKRFKDNRVRLAINYAVDKEEIIEGVLLGLGRICTGPFVPESWAYNKDVQPVAYNTEKAKQLLQEAGWNDSDGDGWLDKDGQAFEFTIVTNQGNQQRQQTAEIIQHRLKAIGIKVNIRILEWAVFLDKFVKTRQFEAIILGWSLSRDPDCYDIWHSSKTKPGEFNFISYSNTEVDRLLEEGRRIFDREERAKIYQQVHQILYEGQPYLFLYVPDSLPAVHLRFRGVEPAPIGIGYNFIDWYVPKSEQRYTQ